MEQVVNIAKWW